MCLLLDFVVAVNPPHDPSAGIQTGAQCLFKGDLVVLMDTASLSKFLVLQPQKE